MTDTICDRCGRVFEDESAIESDGLTVCDDCACLIADEE